jgi:exopolyphosphatase / guanosine-5'-triphosphate,3'-diphosphate pyrophosphatase
MRVATIDIGTNTVLLLVAERAADGSVRPIAEHATITRLGEGVDRTRRLSSAAVARTRECLEDYARVVRASGAERVSAVGTSAMRDAGGAEEVRERVRALLGVDVRVLSGEEEARLTFRGAVSGLAVEERMDVGVFDIGGGSTEVVIGQMEATKLHIAFGASYDIGSVRMTERYVKRDPPARTERAALLDATRRAFANVPRLPNSAAPVGVAGTMTTLAAVSIGLSAYDGARVHGHMMSLQELQRVIERLASLDLEARMRVPGMEPKRADVIVAGGMVALALLEHWAATAVRISDRGVRWGLAEELLS